MYTPKNWLLFHFIFKNYNFFILYIFGFILLASTQYFSIILKCIYFVHDLTITICMSHKLYTTRTKNSFNFINTLYFNHTHKIISYLQPNFLKQSTYLTRSN